MADRALAIAYQPVILTMGAGATVLVAGVAEYRIIVVGLVLTSDAVELATLQDDDTSFMDTHMIAGSCVSMPACESGWIRCASGNSFSIALTNGANVGGMLIYRLVPDHVEL